MLNGVVNMMTIVLHLPSRYIRSLFAGCVPKNITLDATYSRTFQRRYQLYHAENPNPNTNSIHNNNAELLISTVIVSGQELKVLDNPEVVRNFQQIYSNIMNISTYTWNTLLYLENLKGQYNGLGYIMYFDNDGLLDGIV